MASLVKVTTTKVEGQFPAPIGTVWLNPARIDGIKASGSGAIFAYDQNTHGWRDKYAKVTVSESVATLVAACSTLPRGRRVSVSVVKRGGTDVSPAETESINLDNVLMVYQSTSNAAQSNVLIQNGRWKATWFVVSLSAVAFVALAKQSSGGPITKVFTVGYPGSTIDDLTLTSAANQTPQNLKFTGAIPAFAQLQNWSLVTTATFTGAVSLGVTVGTTYTGTDLNTTTNMLTANAISSGGVGLSPFLATAATAYDVYLGVIPGANFNLITAGQLKLTLTYIDTSNS
jgi:hypothetical protein